jgi:single-strand DNA-binding protein
MATKDTTPVAEAETAQPTAQTERRPRAHNRVSLIGRLTADPELRFTGNGTAVTRLRIANNGAYEVQYHTIIAWRKLGEIAAQYLSKGRLVFISGRLQGRNWVGADGAARHELQIVADEIQFLSPKPQERAA